MTLNILRATHIVQVSVYMFRASDWEPVSGRLQQRTMRLIVRLGEVYKGTITEEAGTSVPLEIVQSAPRIPRIFALPSIWSDHELEQGGEFVIFSVSSSHTAREVLAEPPAFRVERADLAVPDLIRAQRAGAPELSVGGTILASIDELENWGYLFAQYLEARLPETFFQEFPDFDVFLRTVEAPQLSPVARRMMMAAAYTKLMLYDPAPPRFINRLLAATARVLGAPYGENLRTAVLDTYLPNLLGLNGGLARKPAADILNAAPAQRDTIGMFLAGSSAPGIRAWLET